MLDTDHFVRFDRVSAVRQTPTGLIADVETERLRIDVVSPTVVRVKMSRGGAFDDSPTHAVHVDPLAGSAEFDIERDPERVRLVTAGLVASVWLEPFRLDVHRTDGPPPAETAADVRGRYWAYAPLNDAFTLRRRCRQADAMFRLGEKSGR